MPPEQLALDFTSAERGLRWPAPEGANRHIVLQGEHVLYRLDWTRRRRHGIGIAPREKIQHLLDQRGQGFSHSQPGSNLRRDGVGVGLGVQTAHFGFDPGLNFSHQLIGLSSLAGNGFAN